MRLCHWRLPARCHRVLHQVIQINQKQTLGSELQLHWFVEDWTVHQTLVAVDVCS